MSFVNVTFAALTVTGAATVAWITVKGELYKWRALAYGDVKPEPGQVYTSGDSTFRITAVDPDCVHVAWSYTADGRVYSTTTVYSRIGWRTMVRRRAAVLVETVSC